MKMKCFGHEPLKDIKLTHIYSLYGKMGIQFPENSKFTFSKT